MSRIYENLSQIYDAGWSRFAEKYVILLEEIIAMNNINNPTILDLACGTGALARMLATNGYITHGIDIAPQMIEIAKQNSRGIADTSFSVGNMADFRTDTRFDIITCTFDSINYLRNFTDIQSMFSCVVGALNDGGFFVFDSNCEAKYIAHDGKIFNKEINGIPFKQSCFYKMAKKESLVRFEFSDGAIEEHYQRPYSLDELQPLLNRCGLKVVAHFSRFDKTVYDANSLQLYCVCQKVMRDK